MHIRTCSRLYVESLVGVNINSFAWVHRTVDDVIGACATVRARA